MSLYFEELFTSFQTFFPENLEELISPVITNEENEKLVRIPTYEEIKEVIFQMPSTKAPGPDGMSPIFYQTYNLN